jgi:hypothetical protein
MLMYAVISPFGATDDRKITAANLLTTITPSTAASQALTVTAAAVPTVPTVSFKSNAGATRIQFDPSNSGNLTDTFDALSIFSSSGLDLGMGVWNSQDGGAFAQTFLYAGTSGLEFLRTICIAAGAANTDFLSVPKSGVITTSNTTTGGLNIFTDIGPLVFATGGHSFSNERGRFDSTGLVLGKASSITGSLNLASASSANVQTFQSATSPSSPLTFRWPAANPTAGFVLTASAPAGGVVTMSWTAGGGSAVPVGPDKSVQFNNAGGFDGIAAVSIDAVNNALVLGVPSTTTGALRFADAGGATTTSIKAGNAASNITYVLPVTDPNLNDVLTASAPSSGVVTLSWTAGGGGGPKWSSLTDPTGDLSLAMAGFVTTFTWTNVNIGSTTGNLTLATNTDDPHQGIVLKIETPGGSNVKVPLAIFTRGSQAFNVDAGGRVSAPKIGTTASEGIGSGYNINGNNDALLGFQAQAQGSNDVSVGCQANAASDNDTVVGFQSVSGSGQGTAIGALARCGNGTARGSAFGYQANVSHADALAFHAGATTTAANQAVFGSQTSALNDWYFGSGVVGATPTAIAFNATGGSGNDVSAQDFAFCGGKGTGSGTPGDLVFKVSTALGSGSTLQTLTERARLTGSVFRLGVPSTTTGSLRLASAGSANTQTHQAPSTPASSLTFVWPSTDPTAGQKLTASAPSGGVVTLTWA